MTTAVTGQEIQLNELKWPWGTVLFYALEAPKRVVDNNFSPPRRYMSSAAYKAFEADIRAMDKLRPSSQAATLPARRRVVYDSNDPKMKLVEALRSTRAELDSTNTTEQVSLDGAADWGLNNCREALAANIFVRQMLSVIPSIVSEIDPVIQVRADLLEKKSTLKRYTRDSSELCPVNGMGVSAFLQHVDIWKSYVEMQIRSLKKMDHSGWNVYKRGYSGSGPKLFCSATTLVEKLSEWLQPSSDLIEASEAKFRYQMGFQRRSQLTVELLSILKVDTECVLFCTGRPPLMFLRGGRIEAIKANAARCEAICKNLETDWLDYGVAFRCRSRWTLLAWGWVIVVLVATSLVATTNPAGRDNWFEIVTDCITVLATLLASVVTFFGMVGEFVENFLSALRGAQTWRSEKNISRDVGKDDMQCLKMELTNIIDYSHVNSQLLSIWRQGNCSYSVTSLQGQIEMSTGLIYLSTPNDESTAESSTKSNASSLIVGRQSAFNFSSGQHYAVVVVSGRLIKLLQVEKPSLSSLFGCQERYEIM